MAISSRSLSLRGFFARSGAVLFCAFVVLFSGCTMDDDGVEGNFELNEALVGTWKGEYNDTFTITAENKLMYDDGYGWKYSGTIEYVSNFTKTAGVIIIKYDADGKAKHYPNDHWLDDAYLYPLKGDYIGIYYKELNSDNGTARFATAYSTPEGLEQATLEEAKAVFTEGNMDEYDGTPPLFTKQQE